MALTFGLSAPPSSKRVCLLFLPICSPMFRTFCDGRESKRRCSSPISKSKFSEFPCDGRDFHNLARKRQLYDGAIFVQGCRSRSSRAGRDPSPRKQCRLRRLGFYKRYFQTLHALPRGTLQLVALRSVCRTRSWVTSRSCTELRGSHVY